MLCLGVAIVLFFFGVQTCVLDFDGAQALGLAVRSSCHQAACFGAGAGRDEFADDDVFFEATQVVDFAGDGSLGEHAGGLLERRSGQEAIGGQRCLGNTEQQRRSDCGHTTLGPDIGVDAGELGLIDGFAGQVVRIAGLVDAHTAQHLTDDDFEVLVVDIHTL